MIRKFITFLSYIFSINYFFVVFGIFQGYNSKRESRSPGFLRHFASPAAPCVRHAAPAARRPARGSHRLRYRPGLGTRENRNLLSTVSSPRRRSKTGGNSGNLAKPKTRRHERPGRPPPGGPNLCPHIQHVCDAGSPRTGPGNRPSGSKLSSGPDRMVTPPLSDYGRNA